MAPCARRSNVPRVACPRPRGHVRRPSSETASGQDARIISAIRDDNDLFFFSPPSVPSVSSCSIPGNSQEETEGTEKKCQDEFLPINSSTSRRWAPSPRPRGHIPSSCWAHAAALAALFASFAPFRGEPPLPLISHPLPPQNPRFSFVHSWIWPRTSLYCSCVHIHKGFAKKLEIRNPKLETNSKARNSKPRPRRRLGSIGAFSLGACFELRTSEFLGKAHT
jgi:hypothetical protein